MLIFITVYNDLENLFRCSHKVSLNCYIRTVTQIVWALCGFFQILQALVIVREDASTVQKWFNYAPVTVYIMLHPFEDTRTVLSDYVFNKDWMLLLSLKGILSWSNKATKFGCWEFSSANWLLVVSFKFISVRDIFWLYCKLLQHLFRAI